jgi:hypothetical protein
MLAASRRRGADFDPVAITGMWIDALDRSYVDGRDIPDKVRRYVTGVGLLTTLAYGLARAAVARASVRCRKLLSLSASRPKTPDQGH